MHSFFVSQGKAKPKAPKAASAASGVPKRKPKASKGGGGGGGGGGGVAEGAKTIVSTTRATGKIRPFALDILYLMSEAEDILTYQTYQIPHTFIH